MNDMEGEKKKVEKCSAIPMNTLEESAAIDFCFAPARARDSNPHHDPEILLVPIRYLLLWSFLSTSLASSCICFESSDLRISLPSSAGPLTV